ncbi:MAG: fibronectin type III domain-containing protein [bacterium]|nr:fibronectin type III domain-containing protein [bacterium]
MTKIGFAVVAVAGLLGASVVLASSPVAADLKVIIVRTDTVAGIYTVSWQARLGCNPGIGTSGASGSMSETVVDEAVEMPLVVNDICQYDLSATFLNAAGETCRIAPGSLRISNDRVNLVVEPNSCTTTRTTQVITIRTDAVAGSYWVSWRTRDGCDPGIDTSGASGWMGRIVSGRPEEIPLVISRTCEYDLSARFENFAGETCRIIPSSLQISNNEVNLVVEPNSCTSTGTPAGTDTSTDTGTPTAALRVIVFMSDTVAGVYTVSWQARLGCDPGITTSGASGSMSWTVVDEAVEMPLVINDICAYDFSATFLNAAGETCRIAPSSLQISNNEVNLAVEPNSCATTRTAQVITIRTDTVAGSYWVSWQTRHGCDPGLSTSGASGWMGRIVSGQPEEIPLVINSACEYDLSARFKNFAGETCRIVPSSLQISNNEVNLVVEPNSCTNTGTPDGPTDEALALEVDESADGGNPLNARFEFATSTDGDRVIASWSPPSSGSGPSITGYSLTISRPGRIFGPFRLSASDRRFAIRNPRADTTYTMRVVAESALGSGLEATTSVTTPPARSPLSPRNVSAAAHGVRQIRVTWSPPPDSTSATISHYLVRYSRPAIGDIPPWQSRLYRTTGTSHTSPNLRFGTTYTVAITAVNHDNRASNPSTTEATTGAGGSQGR